MKNFKITLTVLSAIILLYACKKEEKSLTNEPEKEIMSLADTDLPTTNNPVDAYCYVNYEEDENYTELNKQILDIAIASRNYFKELPDNYIFKSAAKSNKNEAFDLKSFVLQTSQSNQNKSEAFETLNYLINNFKFSTSPSSQAKNNIINYFPAIYIPNLEIADFSKNPIICAGLEVNTNLPGLEKYENYIVGWYYDENETVHEILINENEAMSTTHPVIIIAADVENTNLTLETQIQNDINHNNSSKTNVGKFIDEYEIAYRYDNSNYSEYSYSVVYAYNNGSIQQGGYREEIDEIHKDDIGVLFTNNFEIWQIALMNDLHSVYFVTFEYDWYATMKSVLFLDGAVVNCRMSNSSDYYQVVLIIMSQTYTYCGDKGYLKIRTLY